MATNKHRQQRTYKVAVLGDQYCGKSSIIQRYISGEFKSTYIQTGVGEFYKRDVVVNDTHVSLLIFDTAGQDDQKTVIRSLYRDAHGILLVFDFARRRTLTHINEWMALINTNCNTLPEVLLLGNKTDLDVSMKEVTDIQGKEEGLQHGIEFMEVSAKRNKNIDEAFYTITNQILDKRKSEEYTPLQNGSLRLHKNQPGKKCCS